MPTRSPGVLDGDGFNQPLFVRGDHRNPGDEVPRRFLEAIDSRPFTTPDAGRLARALTGINGVFLSLDLFLFYFFWEVMLVPMYFLIGIYGHGRRVYAAVKFFIFTLASGLLMLLAILGLYYVHGQTTGT